MAYDSYADRFEDLDISLPSSANITNEQNYAIADIDGKYRYVLG
jgi:hypothetical protein